MEKILSVIIPAYNIATTIDKLLETLISDSELLDKLEIMIINDGSKDDTLYKAKEYESKYNNSIIVINKDNGGHGSTVNQGIVKATAKYFKVIDGDDWIDTCNLKKCTEYLATTDVDMVLSPYYEYYTNLNKKKYIRLDTKKKLENVKSYRFNDVCMELPSLCMHSIIFRTAILKDNKICIDEKISYDDNEYVGYPLPYINTVAIFDYPLYYYMLGTEGQSMNRNNQWKKRKDFLIVTSHLIELYVNLDDSLQVKKYLKKFVADVTTQAYRVYLLCGSISPDVKRELKKFDQEIKKLSIEIYKESGGKSIRFLRKMRFILYFLVAQNAQRKNSEYKVIFDDSEY